MTGGKINSIGVARGCENTVQGLNMLWLLCNRSKVIHTHTLRHDSSSRNQTGKEQASLRATYHFKTAFTLPTGKQAFSSQVLPWVLPAWRREAGGRHRNERSRQQPRRAAATPSSGRGRGRGAVDHISPPQQSHALTSPELAPSTPAARRRWWLGHKARDAAIGWRAQVACVRVFVFVPFNERQEVSVVTAQDCGREQAPRGTKQNFGCREEPLRNLG